MLIPVRQYNKFTGTFQTFITCAKTYNSAQQGPRRTLATKDISRLCKRQFQINYFFPPLICIYYCV